MHMNKVTGFLVLLCCELCMTIKVPVSWDESGNSAVKNDPNYQTENIKPQNVQTLQQSQSIPVEYFQYTAQKPQFAADIAAFHGVRNPQQHYKAYPVKPYTEQEKPVLGIHQIQNKDKNSYQPLQNYMQKTEETKDKVRPSSTDYEIFHPYKAEEPALQEIYKDPVLSKIRNDLQDSKNRLHKYEQEAGKPNIAGDEYLESIEKTDSKLFPQQNVPARYEIHRPERRPVYYRVPPRESHREQVLNKRFKHPWHQHNVKIRPMHYKPLKNHIHHLRQQHAIKYDDERNEYPQVHAAENIAEPQDGYDIYEKGKQKYTQLRDSVDESINKAVQKNKPVIYQKLELQKQQPESDDEEEEFVPIKNYAQVRKTETFKHLPKKAAFDDAETYEEVLNAPRLREAVKSTKAQTVYSEEGYEDSAYDHAGEQKHASDHEGHGGFLKENEISKGLYKIPTVLGSYQDGRGSEYRDNLEHGKKWKKNNKEDTEETESEDYSENENEESVDADAYNNRNPSVSYRNKREDEQNTYNSKNNNTLNNETAEKRINASEESYYDFDNKNEANNTNIEHEVDKREIKFKVPEIDLNSTYLSEDEISKIKKEKVVLKDKDNLRHKYPYYFKKLKSIHKNSPLRYAENLKFIPKKSDGGTEFYDSRSVFECPEVDVEVDPIPEKLKKGENPTEENDEKESEELNSKEENPISKKSPRLAGLGDKIDCFKAKYFGENPLDSPFFKEDIITNPEPIVAPKLPIYKQLKATKIERADESKIKNVIGLSDNLREATKSDIFVLLDKLRTDQDALQNSLNKTKSIVAELPTSLRVNNSQQSNVYSDILTNIKNDLQHSQSNIKVPVSLLKSNKDATNITYNFFQNKEDVTKSPPNLRRKRATPFVYEPYKIIRDNQFQDSKKTTTTSNISPLIRQLQSSRVADRVSRSNRDDSHLRNIKPNVSTRTYVDIGRKDRTRFNINPAIVDISMDQRRGEPRYEIRPTNHKSEYTPVENKRAMSVADYKTRTTTEKTDVSTTKNDELRSTTIRSRGSIRQRSTVRPFYDVSSFLPNTKDTQSVAASNAVKKTVTAAVPETVSKEIEHIKEEPNDDSEESGEDYEDGDDDDEEEEIITTTTTATPKPTFRRRVRVSTTTEKTLEQTHEDQPDRLKLVTRFRNYKPSAKPEKIVDVTEPSVLKKYIEKENIDIPKYREKKKKSSESTLVTDTKKYGSDDDDEDYMRKEEVDALIGVKQNMDDYTPLYEKEEEDKEMKQHSSRTPNKTDDDDDEEEEDDDDNDEDDDDEDDDDDDDNDDDEEERESNEDEEIEEEQPEPKVTTPEPTKRTLARTTDAPSPTVASRIRTTTTPRIPKPENKPIVTRKKIEIHKELPVNKSSPHVTQFKQDIKEVEIIKEIPTRKRRPQKKVEPLELYKDDNLAKEINKLGDVEIFNEGIDVDRGPRHGGNYRKASKEDLKLLKTQSKDNKVLPKDVEASQSENTKHIELDEYEAHRMHGGNLKSINDMKRTRNSGRSGKIIELNDSPVSTMHGGNLKIDHRRRGGRRNEKLVELVDDRSEEQSQNDDDYKTSHQSPKNDRMHGGNYRSSKLVEEERDDDDIRVKNPGREARRSATLLLNNFVQAVPVLTTTPGYIVDPSKRMYYYVDT